MTKRALVVANQRYRDAAFTELPSAGADATALRQVLADPAIGGFSVEVLRDVRSAAFRRAIEGFFRDAERDDLLLMHVSCHGVKNRDGRLFLTASDTEKAYLASTGIDCGFLDEQMEASYCEQIVLLLDCCYSGAFARGFKARSGEAVTEVEVAESLSGRGRIVITASTALQFSHEPDLARAGKQPRRAREPSVFTAAIVEGLGTGAADLDGDGVINADELYHFVRRRVHEVIPNQTPTRRSSVEGMVAIARVASRPDTSRAALPAEDIDLLPFAGLVRGDSEHSVMCVAFEISLACQGRREVLSRTDLFAKLSAAAEDPRPESIGYTMPTALRILTRTGVESDPPGRLFRARTSRVRSPEDVIRQLRDGRPILAGALVTQAWQDPAVSASGVLPAGTATASPVLGGMAILVLGYRAAPPALRVLIPWPGWGHLGLGWFPVEQGLWDGAWSIEAFEDQREVTRSGSAPGSQAR